MAYRLGVDVGGTFTDLFLVEDSDHRQWRVKTPSTPSDPSPGRAQRREPDLRGGGDQPRGPGQRRARHHGRDERRARIQGRPRRPDHDAGLRPDPPSRAQPDAGPAGGLDHHGQAGPAGVTGRHARGGRAPGRAREHARRGGHRAGQGHHRGPGGQWRRVAHDQPHQLVRQRRARAADRRPGRGAAPRLPGHDLERRPAGVPRVRADSDRLHELLRAPAGGAVRGPPAVLAVGHGRQDRGRHPAQRRRRDDAGRGRPQPGLRRAERAVGRRRGRALCRRAGGLPERAHVRHGRHLHRRVAVPGGGADDRPRDHDRPVPDQGPERGRAHRRRGRRLDRARPAAHPARCASARSPRAPSPVPPRTARAARSRP